MVELRWAIPAHTTAQAPRLQYRNFSGVGLGQWGDWTDVPYVVVPQQPPKPAPTLSALVTPEMAQAEAAFRGRTPGAKVDAPASFTPEWTDADERLHANRDNWRTDGVPMTGDHTFSDHTLMAPGESSSP